MFFSLSKLSKKIARHCLLLAVVLTILLAIALSLGRGFMPSIARYKHVLEEQIYLATGLPVVVNSLRGSFQGFNPAIEITDLQLLVPDDASTAVEQATALGVANATIVLNLSQTIWQRRWVLEDFLVNDLNIEFDQDDSGQWQLRGIQSGGQVNVDLGSIYGALRRVSSLSLTNLSINLNTSAGRTSRLRNGTASIQNQGNTNYIHINANMENNPEQLAFSVEVQGRNLDELIGLVHFNLPEADYSSILADQHFGDFTIDGFTGGGDFWLSLSDGNFDEFVSSAQVGSFTFRMGENEATTLNNLSGRASLARGEGPQDLAVAVQDFQFDWQDTSLAPFNAYLYYAPQDNLLARVDRIDVSFLTDFGMASGLLSGALRDELTNFAPRGDLENLNLFVPLAEAPEVPVNLVANIRSAELASRGGTPAMWGINGFIEINYDLNKQLLTGLAEVESDEFRIHLPKVFNDSWQYDYVNGSLRFSLDQSQGQQLTLVSNIIYGESEAVTGKVKFSTLVNRDLDGNREAELSLLVGAEQVKLEQMSLYLPTGPGVADSLRSSMEWLNTAVLDGEVRNSGVIFRGSTLSGSGSISKTFQSFYQAEDAKFEFSSDWPGLTEVSAAVITDDNNINVQARGAESLGIRIDEASATVTKDEQNITWLNIDGQVSGASPDGFHYLSQAPLDQGLKNKLADWDTSGSFNGDVTVSMPISSGTDDPHVIIAMQVQDNQIEIPEYALQFRGLNGPVHFDTEIGLNSSGIKGELFDRAVELQLSSQMLDGKYTATNVIAQGSVAVPDLISWPRQNEVVGKLLSQASGEIHYLANLGIQSSDEGVTNHLQLDSDLQGVSLTLPQPYGKTADTELPLYLSMNFSEHNQQISGSLGEDLNYQLTIRDDLVDGFILAGAETTMLDAQPMAKGPGIAVVGHVDYLNLEQWLDFIKVFSGAGGGAGSVSTGSSPGEISQAIEFIDLDIAELDFYGQLLPDVVTRIDSAEDGQGWELNVLGDAVSGDVYIPSATGQYLTVNLDHLYLPAIDEDTQEIGSGMSSTLRQDPLAAVDPRELIPMQIKADEVRIGERPFGRWEFTIDPVTDGVEVNDLAFDFRGIQGGALPLLPEPGAEAGADADVAVPPTEVAAAADEELDEQVDHPPLRFSWRYDGNEHHSNLEGGLRAENLADVLTANGFAPSIESSSANFNANIDWPGTPAFFNALTLSGDVSLDIRNGRFLQESGGNNALKLISVLNLDALMRRLRFSDDLLRRGLAYDEISGNLLMTHGLVEIQDQLVISGPSSHYQISGLVDLPNQSINAEMYLTLPVSDNIPWIGLLTGQLPIAVGAFLFDQIFGDQVDSLTSAVYTLKGPLEGLEPEFKQAFGAPPAPAVNENIPVVP